MEKLSHKQLLLLLLNNRGYLLASDYKLAKLQLIGKYRMFLNKEKTNMEKLTGIELIVKERQEQIEKHGHTVVSDVENHLHKRLLIGAAALISQKGIMPTTWNVEQWNKMQKKSYKERLIIAAAFLAAEIDCINYLEEDATDGN